MGDLGFSATGTRGDAVKSARKGLTIPSDVNRALAIVSRPPRTLGPNGRGRLTESLHALLAWAEENGYAHQARSLKYTLALLDGGSSSDDILDAWQMASRTAIEMGRSASAKGAKATSGFWDIRPKVYAELRKATEIINSQFRPTAAATHVSRAVGLLNEWAALPTASAREQGAVTVSMRRLQEAIGNLHDGNSAAISRANNLILRVLERDLDI